MITNLGCWCSYLCVDIYEFLQQCNKNADRRLMRLNSFVGLVILSFTEHSQHIWIVCGSGSTSVHYIRPCSSASINKELPPSSPMQVLCSLRKQKTTLILLAVFYFYFSYCYLQGLSLTVPHTQSQDWHPLGCPHLPAHPQKSRIAAQLP